MSSVTRLSNTAATPTAVAIPTWKRPPHCSFLQIGCGGSRIPACSDSALHVRRFLPPASGASRPDMAKEKVADKKGGGKRRKARTLARKLVTPIRAIAKRQNKDCGLMRETGIMLGQLLDSVLDRVVVDLINNADRVRLLPPDAVFASLYKVLGPQFMGADERGGKLDWIVDKHGVPIKGEGALVFARDRQRQFREYRTKRAVERAVAKQAEKEKRVFPRA